MNIYIFFILLSVTVQITYFQTEICILLFNLTKKNTFLFRVLNAQTIPPARRAFKNTVDALYNQSCFNVIRVL